MSSFGIKLVSKENMEFQLSGKIDETADFSVVELGLTPKVRFDLDKVEGINSMGIRKWIEWTKTLPTGTKITYVHCPKVIVEQFNIVEHFLPEGAVVESFYVPYYCESLDEVFNVLYTKGKHYGDGNINVVDSIQCGPLNDRTAELDVIPDKYFKFVRK